MIQDVTMSTKINVIKLARLVQPDLHGPTDLFDLALQASTLCWTWCWDICGPVGTTRPLWPTRPVCSQHPTFRIRPTYRLILQADFLGIDLPTLKCRFKRICYLINYHVRYHIYAICYGFFSLTYVPIVPSLSEADQALHIPLSPLQKR